MKRIAAIAALIAEAAKHIYNPDTKSGVYESNGSNRSPFIDQANALCNAPKGSPWCASFEALCAHISLGTLWPVPLTADCDTILAWGQKRRIVYRDPQKGDIFLIINSSDSDDATHTGIVTEVTASGIKTIEGNTNNNGSREGYACLARTRLFSSHIVYVRWASQIDDIDDTTAPALSDGNGVPASTWKVTFGPVEKPTDTIGGYIDNNTLFVNFREFQQAIYGADTNKYIGWSPEGGATWIDRPVPQSVPRRNVAGHTFFGARALAEWQKLEIQPDNDKKTAHVYRPS